MASVIRQYRIEYEDEDPKDVDRNIFLSSFSMENIWTVFRRTRPPDKSSFNFLDGMRTFSMIWVCRTECILYLQYIHLYIE